MKKNSKFSKIFLGIVGILFLLGGLFSLVSKASYIFLGNAKPLYQLIYEDSFDDYVNDYVEIEVDAVLENFASTTHTVNFIPVGKDQHYIAWLDDDSVIAVSVGSGKVSEMNRIMDETWDYLDYKSDYLTNDSIKLKGQLKKVSGELLDYYNDALESLGVEEVGLKVRNLVVDGTESRIMELLVSLFLLGIGGVLLFSAFAKEKTNEVVPLETNEEDNAVYSDSNVE